MSAGPRGGKRSHHKAPSPLAPRTGNAGPSNPDAPLEPLSHAHRERGASAPDPAAPLCSSCNSLTTTPKQEEEGLEQDPTRDREDLVVAAIEAKTGRQVYPRPNILRDRIAALVRDYDLDTVLAAVAAAEANYLPPRVVGHAEAVCRGRIALPGPRGDDLATRAANLRALITVYEDNGEDTTNLVAELAACENGLRPAQEATA